jgi:hypothetical protein
MVLRSGTTNQVAKIIGISTGRYCTPSRSKHDQHQPCISKAGKAAARQQPNALNASTSLTSPPLHQCIWDGNRVYPDIPLSESRDYVLEQLRSTREDHLRDINPTPYKVSVSEELYGFVYHLWAEEFPVTEPK